jgi:lysophospholipase L1-like esterase
VTFLLGINDCFAANPDDPVAMEKHINGVLDHADGLLAAFHAAAPQAVLAVGLTTPPNARESGFEANYKGKYHRWGWKRIQHRLVQRMMERFGKRQADNIFLVPTELNLDPVDGYPENNGVHPNPAGYAQIGASFHAWLKAWMSGALE